jgi:hypothetical protein
MRAGLAAYLHALDDAYFHDEWLLALALALFVVAAIRYRVQSSLVQWLILAAPLEFAMVAVHQTRFVRFLLVALLPLWLVAGSEVGHWVSRWRRMRLVAGLAAPFVLTFGLVTAREIVHTDRFRSIAFNNYIHSEPLRAAFASLRGAVTADDRIAVQGQSEELSPGLFMWQLGPPSDLRDFPTVVTSDNLGALNEATRVVLVAPTEPELAPSEISTRYPTHAAALQQRVDRGEFRFEREFPVSDLHVSFRLYRRR